MVLLGLLRTTQVPNATQPWVSVCKISRRISQFAMVRGQNSYPWFKHSQSCYGIVPSPPRSLLDRLKYLEDHIIHLDREYPPWAALHFNQPNRGVRTTSTMNLASSRHSHTPVRSGRHPHAPHRLSYHLILPLQTDSCHSRWLTLTQLSLVFPKSVLVMPS